MKKQTGNKTRKTGFITRRDEIIDSICAHPQKISSDVLKEVIELAIEIAREGREGRKVGTIFVVGDVDNVKKHSRPLILDPLSRHKPP